MDQASALDKEIKTRIASLKRRSKLRLRDITKKQWQSFQVDDLRLLELMIERAKLKEFSSGTIHRTANYDHRLSGLGST